jgi:hypothetical protein
VSCEVERGHSIVFVWKEEKRNRKKKKKKREIGGLLSVHLPESSGNYVVKYIQNVECGIGSHNYGGRIPV